MKIKRDDLMRLWDIAVEMRAMLTADYTADTLPLYKETHVIEDRQEDRASAMCLADMMRAMVWIQPDLGCGELVQVFRPLDIEVVE